MKTSLIMLKMSQTGHDSIFSSRTQRNIQDVDVIVFLDCQQRSVRFKGVIYRGGLIKINKDATLDS